jgi:hypothetical protein
MQQLAVSLTVALLVLCGSSRLHNGKQKLQVVFYRSLRIRQKYLIVFKESP